MPAKKKKKAVAKKRILKKKPAKKKIIKKKKPVKRPALKRKPVKKAKKRVAAKKKAAVKALPKIQGDIVGSITHYFPKVRAAVIKVKAPITIGDTLRIKGHTTDFKQPVSSMQIDRVPVTAARKGDEIGLLVDSRVRQHDTVYKV